MLHTKTQTTQNHPRQKYFDGEQFYWCMLATAMTTCDLI